MEMTVTFNEPEPGQLEDGECFAQPFYRLWGGSNQPICNGVFDGVGEDAMRAYDDAVLSIERHLQNGDEDRFTDLMHHAYDMASHDLVWYPVGGPYVCRLLFDNVA
jgi:hypothetical protein